MFDLQRILLKGCGKTGTLFDPSKPVNIIELHFCAA